MGALSQGLRGLIHWQRSVLRQESGDKANIELRLQQRRERVGAFNARCSARFDSGAQKLDHGGIETLDHRDLTFDTTPV